MRWALLLALLPPQDTKAPVPPDAALAKAEQAVREQYRDEIAVKNSASQLKLARDLGAHARETKDDAAKRYVLFREACDAAARAGAVDTLVLSLNELYGGFEINGLALKESFHLKIEPNVKPEDLKRLAEADLKLVEEAVELDQYDVAVKFCRTTMSLARTSKDAGLSARAEAALKTANEFKAAYEKAKKAEEALGAASEDREANQVWGDWLCLMKGKWDKGLPFLSKGQDGPVRNAAVKEFSASSEVNSLVDAADAWWDLVDRERHPVKKRQMLAHARSIYATALPRSTGLVRAKIGKRLEFDRDPPVKEAASKEEEEALKAEATLAAKPNDPEANLTLGRFLAFTRNDWAAALPRLAKGSDATLKGLAERELAEPRTPAEKAELGEAWAAAAAKLPALKKNLQERATTWYQLAWPGLDAAAKDRLRSSLRKTYQGSGTPSKAPPKDWTFPTAEAKVGVSTVAPRTGRNGMQITCVKVREGLYPAFAQNGAARPAASYELSCWVLCDDTNSEDDTLEILFHAQDGRLLLQTGAKVAADLPWPRKVEARCTAPEAAAKFTVQFGVRSSKGTIFVDDVSLKQDGREILKNGSFEP